MTIKDRIMEKAGDKYLCLENDNVDNTDVITIANRDSDALLLNYEIGDSTITVNVVNKDEGSIVDSYSTEYDDSSFDNKVDTSIATYEAIKKSVAHRLAEEKSKSYTDEDISKFRDIIANGGSREIYKLSKEDLQKMYDFVSDCDDYKSARALILWQVQDALDDFDRPEDKRKKFEGDESDIEEVEPDITYVDAKEGCIEFTDASIPDLIQASIDKLDAAIEETDDENKKIILDDVSAQLIELLDEVSSYVEE